MQFKLLKPILEFSAGYILHVSDTGFGILGQSPWGWEIPYFIMKANPTWFEEITTNEQGQFNWEEVK